MALINLNALGYAIRTKVGETEKKTLPQLKDIVDNQLVYPQGELNVTTNGNYDVKSYASVNVETDERTDTDRKNAEDVVSWNSLFAEKTGEFTSSISSYTGIIPYVNAKGCNSMRSAFMNFKCSKITVEISDICTGLNGAFQAMSNVTEITILGTTRNVTNFNYLFNNSPVLEKIIGELDFTSATAIGLVFSNCQNLADVRIKPKSISIDNDFTFYYESPKNIVLEMINGLAEVTSYHTTTFGSTIKTRMGATATKAIWWCKLVDGIYVDCSETDEGAISYASAITAKGWTIS